MDDVWVGYTVIVVTQTSLREESKHERCEDFMSYEQSKLTETDLWATTMELSSQNKTGSCSWQCLENKQV